MINRRYESYTKRGLLVFFSMPGIVLLLKPIFNTVSIMPGIDERAPLRQLTSKGFSASSYFIPIRRSIFSTPFQTSSIRP